MTSCLLVEDTRLVNLKPPRGYGKKNAKGVKKCTRAEEEVAGPLNTPLQVTHIFIPVKMFATQLDNFLLPLHLPKPFETLQYQSDENIFCRSVNISIK